MKQRKNIIFIVFFIIVLLLLYFSNLINAFNSLSDEEIKSYIISELNNKYNKKFTAKLISKKESTICKFWLDTCLIEKTIPGAYEYIFSIKSEDDLMAYAYYTNSYNYAIFYNYEATLKDNFYIINEKSTKLDAYLSYINNYITDGVIKKIEFHLPYPDGELDDIVYLDLYFSITTIDLTEELYAKLHCLSYDIDKLNEQNGDILRVRGIFADEPEKYLEPHDLYTMYGLGRSMRPSGLYNNNINDLDDNRREAYDKIYSSLVNTIGLEEESGKLITNSFMKIAYHYINDVKSVTYRYYEKVDKYEIYVKNYTKNGNLLRLSIVLENKNGKYIGEEVRILDSSTSTIIDRIELY